MGHAQEGHAGDEHGDAAMQVPLLVLLAGPGDGDHGHRNGDVHSARDERVLGGHPRLRPAPRPQQSSVTCPDKSKRVVYTSPCTEVFARQ